MRDDDAHGPTLNKTGYPDRKVPEATPIVRTLLPATLVRLAVPLTASKGDVNLTIALGPHAEPNPLNVMIMLAGRVMYCWYWGLGVKATSKTAPDAVANGGKTVT